MAYKLGTRSLGFCQHVDPVLMEIAHAAIARSPVDFGMTENQSRTLAQQRKKVADGHSKTLNSKHIIQASGHSKALDLVPWVDGKFTWGDPQWRVQTVDGRTLTPFYDIAEAMRAAAVARGVRLVWGAIWDRTLNDLPAGAANLKAAVEGYKARRRAMKKGAFLDGPHFEMKP